MRAFILPGTKGSVMAASYPYSEETYKTYKSAAVESDMAFISELISGIRNIRSEMNIQPSMKIKVLCFTDDEKANSFEVFSMFSVVE